MPEKRKPVMEYALVPPKIGCTVSAVVKLATSPATGTATFQLARVPKSLPTLFQVRAKASADWLPAKTTSNVRTLVQRIERVWVDRYFFMVGRCGQ